MYQKKVNSRVLKFYLAQLCSINQNVGLCILSIGFCTISTGKLLQLLFTAVIRSVFSFMDIFDKYMFYMCRNILNRVEIGRVEYLFEQFN